jgi:repressor LexA
MPVKKSERLTDRQRSILKFIERHVLANGYPPTIREIGEATGIASTSVVNYNLNKLTRLGYLNRTSTKSRGIKLTEKTGRPVHVNPMTVNVKYYGQIVAGQPMPVPDDSQFANDEHSQIEVAPSMIGNADPAEVFALRVKGDSMIDAMIQDGDIVILRPVTDQVKSGDMVAIYLLDKGETTLKHYFLEKNDMVRLQPAHPTMEPIYVHASRCQVQGRVLSVLRMLR